MSGIILSGAVAGLIIAAPLYLLYGAVRLLIKVVAQSKLSLDDYLKVIEER